MAMLTEGARGDLERYLSQVRLALRGHSSVDAGEVERDVRAHIDAELTGVPEPVGVDRLRQVLDQLGTPHAWVPEDELPGWRRAVARMQSGPGDWRLAGLTFILFLLSPALFAFADTLWPLPLFAFLPSILIARATLSVLAEQDEPVGARGWLIYPPLVLLYVPLAVMLLVWPLPLTAGVLEDEHNSRAAVEAAFAGPFWRSAVSIAAVTLGTWWTMLGLALAQFPGAVRAAFLPFADWFERRHGLWLAAIGLLSLSIGGAVLLATKG
jgi:hypothetical protein